MPRSTKSSSGPTGNCNDGGALALRQPRKNPQVGIQMPLERRVGYVQVSKSLVYGYPYVSDGAKLTYILLLSLDYQERGEVWYGGDKLAKLRGVAGWGALYWHLRELTHFGLIERQERPYARGMMWAIGSPLRLQLELERSHHIRAYMSGRDGVGDPLPWPTNFDRSFRDYVYRTASQFIADLETTDALVREWHDIRSRRQSHRRRATGSD